ncbi:hypothetical protein, partial [Neisseria gonorrhoeae]|uniref:hypothetical protein n=1 Tax=Neisseria gonorrhoeae TaxID=485 RepID=UPI002804E0D9
PQGQKTKNRNLKFVIPAKAGIQFVEFQLFRINFETLIPSFPRGRESGPLVRQMRGRVARLSDKNRV